MNGERTSLLADRDPRLKWAVLASFAVHLVVLGGALAFSSLTAAPKLDMSQKPIMAKLVRLGTPRDKHLLPRKYKVPPPPKPTVLLPEKTVEPPKPEPPKPEAKPDPKKPEPKPESKPEPKPEKPKVPERGKDPLAAAVARLGEIDPKAKADELPPGAADGDPYGDSDVGSEGDRYLALVQRAVRDNYKVPSVLSDRERTFLNATVVIFVAPDGTILSREVEKSSGNQLFDAALLRAVDDSNPLPPPPDGWREKFRTEGLGLKFRL